MTPRIFLAIGLAVLLAACDPGAPPDPREAEPTTAPDTALGGAATLNVGDVEAQVWVEGTIDPDFEDPNVEVQETVDQRRRRNLVHITVSPPYPEELWLHYETTAMRSFPDTPAVIRTRILRNGEEIGRIAGVFAAEAQFQEYSTRVNALEGLDTIPDSLLITTEGESLLMPRGADPGEIEPWEAVTEPGRRSNFVYCNPIRISFLGADEEPPDDVLEVETLEPELEEAPGDEDEEAPEDEEEAPEGDDEDDAEDAEDEDGDNP